MFSFANDSGHHHEQVASYERTTTACWPLLWSLHIIASGCDSKSSTIRIAKCARLTRVVAKQTINTLVLILTITPNIKSCRNSETWPDDAPSLQHLTYRSNKFKKEGNDEMDGRKFIYIENSIHVSN